MQGTVKVAEFFRSSICCFVCLCHTAAFCYSRSISLIPDSGTFVNEWFLLQKNEKTTTLRDLTTRHHKMECEAKEKENRR